MSTNSDRDAMRTALRSWGERRRRLEAERDPLVRQALEAGVIKEDIHKLTDLGRTTIDRIEKAPDDG
jgi:DNA invertase Pin-like site-specific DNA recombinase